MAVNCWDPDEIATELDADGTHNRVGRDKADPSPGSNLDTQVLLTEWNSVKSAVPWLHTQVGTLNAPDKESLRGKLGGDVFCWIEPFVDALTLTPRWSVNWTSPTVVATAGGGYSFVLDDAISGCDLQSNQYWWNAAQQPIWRARYTLTGNPGTHFVARFEDGTGNKGWGIKLLAAGAKIQGFTRTGGVDTDTDLDTWTTDVEVLIEQRITAGHLWVSIDGGTATDCGAVDSDDMALHLYADTGGTAGKVCVVRTGLLLADWS